MSDDHAGRLEAIWIKRVKNGPMDARPQVVARAGEGLEGNANQRGKRQVTILSAERWRNVCADLGAEVDPRLRRANLFVRGVELAGSRGRVLRVGPCRVLVRGESRGCRKMEESHPGLLAALDGDWRGGAYGEVIEGGLLEVGAEVRWEQAASSPSRAAARSSGRNGAVPGPPA